MTMSIRTRSGKQYDALFLSDHSEHNLVPTISDTSNLSDLGSEDIYKITKAPLRSVVRNITHNDEDRGITRMSNVPCIDRNNSGGHKVVSDNIVDFIKLTP
ncbi:hypothetical protein DPMN_057947 [Dreissena polymorpha]|uniref:Uncharacterized protein n=1 Tax=Dreissena polymorpha TaxID=45954 RepID=A0A9D4C0U6_DREPO|nr:hypothetical protein DPMN_057947 [Dreissena polymorpha]